MSDALPLLAGSRKQGLARWKELDSLRDPLMTRMEKYAGVTLPRLMLPKDQDEFSSSLQHDSQSIGAQGANHMSNKMMLALFRPSAPFFRTDPDADTRAALQAQGIDDEAMREGIVQVERDALKVLDSAAIRPMLHEAVLNLLVLGNVLIDLTDDDMEMDALRDYVVRRNMRGKPVEILRRSRVLFDELEEDVQGAVHARDPNTTVDFIRHYTFAKKKWTLRQYVNDEALPEEFDQTWGEDKFEVHALVWNLAKGRHYGTGLVEDYAGDFALISTLTDSEIALAIKASDYRWAAHPSGLTSLEDFKNSTNGSVISGRPEDIQMVGDTSSASALQYLGMSIERAIRRVSGAFLLNSAITRNAERVTAEEIRQQAEELDTAVGGIYSRIAVSLQVPLARWLLRKVSVDIRGTKLVLSIVTGVDAMSRNAEAYQVRLFLEDLQGLSTIGASVPELNRSPVIRDFAAARGLSARKYVKSQEALQQEQQATTDMQTNAAVTEQAGKALAQGAVKGTE